MLEKENSLTSHNKDKYNINSKQQIMLNKCYEKRLKFS